MHILNTCHGWQLGGLVAASHKILLLRSANTKKNVNILAVGSSQCFWRRAKSNAAKNSERNEERHLLSTNGSMRTTFVQNACVSLVSHANFRVRSVTSRCRCCRHILND